MSESDQVCAIVPAFNEERTIGDVVRELLARGDVQSVIVVNDHSVDRTAAIAREAGAFVAETSGNVGYDGALAEGFRFAQALGFQYAVTCDADGQHDVEDVRRMVQLLRERKARLIVGVRPRTARLFEKVFAFYTNIRFGLRDPLCGMKGYDMGLYRDLGHFDSYNSIGTELALYALKQGKPFIQVPISIKERQGASRFGSSVKSNLKILRSLLKGICFHWRQ